MLQTWLFLAFAVAFAIKVPLFPFHTWLPDAHVEAPTAGSVILAGVLLKMGTYGLLRFAFPLFPAAALQFAPWIAMLAVIGIVYGALVAMVQPDMKKLVAYSSVSHLGFVVLGLCALNVNGVQGAVYQMLAHGISTGGLFLIVGMLSDRRHTRAIAEYGGLKAVTPKLVAAFLLVTLASVALPGMNGFVGEFLILLGAFGSAVVRPAPRVYTAVAATGVILSAVYMLWMFQRVNYGPITNDKNRGLRDLSVREWFVIAPICAMAIVMGVVPGCVPEADGAGGAQGDRGSRRRQPDAERCGSASSHRRAETPPKRSLLRRRQVPAPSSRDRGRSIMLQRHHPHHPGPDRHAVGVRGAAGRVVPAQGRLDAGGLARRHRPRRRHRRRRSSSGTATPSASASSSSTTTRSSSTS